MLIFPYIGSFFNICIYKYIYSLPEVISNSFNNNMFLFYVFSLVCRNICERIRYRRISFGTGGNYSDGKKYCRRYEVYMYHTGLFCPCCGMQLRLTSSSRECKEILRKRKASGIETIA